MTGNLTVERGENAKSPYLTLTVKQLASRMQVSMPTAYAMTEWTGFPVLRVGKKKLVRLAALERWLVEQVYDEEPQQKARAQCKNYKTGRM